jgi:hypothetical protein
MIINILFVLTSIFGFSSDTKSPFSSISETNLLIRFKKILENVREQKISPSDAKNEFKNVMKSIRELYPNTINPNDANTLVFPLIGSHISAVGGKGQGYYVKNFDLFDHTVSGSHPAHDIFIFDPDQDCIDNRKGEYIDVVSVSNGLVMAIQTEWADTSNYRGGNYVWVYDIERGGLWYYAHNRVVEVEAGQMVKAGDKLGEVGRTGFNAAMKRSDTHLHLMYLELDSELLPQPVNFYEWLQHSIVLKKSNIALKNKKFKFEINKIEPLKTNRIKTKYN